MGRSVSRARPAPPRPRGTSRPGCGRAGAGRGWSRRPGDWCGSGRGQVAFRRWYALPGRGAVGLPSPACARRQPATATPTAPPEPGARLHPTGHREAGRATRHASRAARRRRCTLPHRAGDADRRRHRWPAPARLRPRLPGRRLARRAGAAHRTAAIDQACRRHLGRLAQGQGVDPARRRRDGPGPRGRARRQQGRRLQRHAYVDPTRHPAQPTRTTRSARDRSRPVIIGR